MHYSKVLFALPIANAAVIARNVQPRQADVVVVDTVIDYAYVTDVVTQYGNAPPTAAVVTVAAAPTQGFGGHGPGGHSAGGHSRFHSSHAAAPTSTSTSVAQAQTEAPKAVAPVPAHSSSASSAAAAPASTGTSSGSSNSGSSSSGGCPLDTSGQHLSPGVNGAPAKSEIDSINYLRRLYNPNAACLSWSTTLASASQTCADAQSESHLRANSDIVSAPGFETSNPGYTGSLASTQFERSMIWMLCQSPSDPELKGTCGGKTGEVGCSGGACTGHHDAIVDKEGTNHFMGCGSSSGTTWLSCSFSKTDGVF